MRRVDRASVDVPATFLPGRAAAKELQAAKDHRDDTKPDKKAFEYKAYKRDDVRAALEKLFYGKCAYCETRYAASAPVDIEHYRPKGAVAEDVDHGGYWWIAMDWQNLLPSCIDCNRKRGQVIITPSSSLADLANAAKSKISQSGKKDSFPLAATGVRAIYDATDFGVEHALLVNPCNEDPASSLAYCFDSAHPAGLIIPTGDAGQQERGAVSIQVYGLNRLKLVQDRTRVLRRLEFLGDLVIELADSITSLEEPEAVAAVAGTSAAKVASRLRLLRDRALSEMRDHADPEAEYASLAAAWLEIFKERLR